MPLTCAYLGAAGKKVGSDREKQGSGKQPPNGRQESRQSFSRDKNSKLAKATVRRVGKLQDDLEPTLEASVPFLHTAEEMIKAHKVGHSTQQNPNI